MKRSRLLELGLLLLFPLFSLAENEKRKTYSWGVIPASNYDSDLGYRYGGVLNIFDYGYKSREDKYEQYLFIKLTNTSRGTLQAQALLESESLISNTLTLAELSYTREKKMDFFGFNGYQSIYQKRLHNPSHPEFINSFFYAYERELLRLRFDVQSFIAGSKLRLLTGFSYMQYKVALPAGIGADSTQNLLGLYKHWGLLDPTESKGGQISLFTAGLVFDTRNDACYCTDGRWAEAVIMHSPALLSSAAYTRLAFTYREHRSFLDEKFTLSYRISFQQTISGSIPFYALTDFYDSRLNQDGVGGAHTLRGAMRGRIAAEGYVLGNLESRVRLIDFRFLKQDFFTSASLFYDNSYISKPRATDLNQVPHEARSMHFKVNKSPAVHHTIGAGLYFVFNRNNIISVNYGIPLNKQDGNGGLYVGSALLF